MPKLKTLIWFVYNFDSPGGGERWILEAQKVLRKKGVKTHIICIKYDEKVLFNNSYNVPVSVLGRKTPKLGGFIQKSISFLSMVRLLRRQFSLTKPDMIMNQGLREYVITYLATRFSSYKYSNMDFGQLYQIGGIDIIYSRFFKIHLSRVNSFMQSKGEKLEMQTPELSFKKRLQNEVKGLLLYLSYRNAVKIFTLSEKVKNEAKLQYKRDAIVLKGAYDDKLIRDHISSVSNPSKQKPLILTIGRLVPHKRVDLCIRSIDMLRRETTNFHFHIGGTGPELENLKTLCHELGVEEYVKFVGFIDESALMDYYSSCQVFTVMDSADYDITPMVALAMGKRVVCPNIMEFSDEIINSGQLFRTDPQPQKIAHAMLEALGASPNKSISNMYELYQDYTWDSCFSKMYNTWISSP